MLDNNNNNWKQYSKWVLGSSNVELMGVNYSSLVGQQPETKGPVVYNTVAVCCL
jgi:hypothetical protein